jgi:putative nucleotidyltransferase with HDIG domain/PAS domain S-box-containing protein
MKSRLSISIILFGWSLFFIYIYHDISTYGWNFFAHFTSLTDIPEIILHILIITAPIGSTITAFLVNERRKLFVKTSQSEKQLRHAANEWRATFDSIEDGIILTDTDFNIIRANKHISSLTDVPLKELVYSKKCFSVVHSDKKKPENCPLQRSMKSKETETLEYYDQRFQRHFRESVSPVLNEKGEIIAYVHALVDLTEMIEKEKKLTQAKEAFFNMLKDLDATYTELKGIYNSLIVAFANVIDTKSHWTKGHSERVTQYALLISREMKLKEDDISTLKTAGLLHDIGKIGTYDEILDKPGRLTDAEFEMVKKHPIKGVEIISPIKGLELILPIVRSHHEKVDGSGYPDGLKADDIPLLAKILCIADSFDAMTSDRPYRPAPGLDYAISEIRRCSGKHFDPQIVGVFLRILEKNIKVCELTS